MAKNDASLVVTIGSGGWIRFGVPSLPPVFARFEPNPADGRLEVVELHIGAGRLEAADLRRVPFGAIAGAANHPDVKPLVLASGAVPADVWTAPADAPSRRSAGLLEKVDYRMPDLKVPDSKPYPDEFYEKVAAHYRRLVIETPRPAVVLANATGVPVSTAHAWIKRARERGYLPQGRKGARG